jgi:ParB/RepB/Spo0J family partition protein
MPSLGSLITPVTEEELAAIPGNAEEAATDITPQPVTPPAAKPSPKIVRIPIAQIEVNPAWNSRCRSAVLAEGEEDPSTGMGSNGIRGLVASIRVAGQSSPVDVIPNGKSAIGKPYFLVAGFRRIEALSRIAKEDNDPAPAVDAIVRDLSPVAARLLNLRENTARDDLRGADLVYGVSLLIQAAPKMTGTAIAQELNKSQTHISKILKMLNRVDPELIKHWRDTPGNPVTMQNMVELANLEDYELQKKTYYELFRGTLSTSAGDDKKKNDWKASAKRRATKMGTLLGTLAREYGLDCECLGDFEDCLIDMVKLPADVRKKDVGTFAKACHAAYLAAIAYSPAAEGEDEDEEYDGPGKESDA